MEWNVNTVDVKPNEEKHDDVIYNVHWSVSKEAKKTANENSGI